MNCQKNQQEHVVYPLRLDIFFLLDVLVSLYYSLFASFLQYGIVVWGLTYDTYIKPIFILQKKVLRAITFNNFSAPSAPIFLTLRLLKLQDLFEMKLLTFVLYEAVNKFSPSCFLDFLMCFRKFISMILGRHVKVTFF